MDKIRKQKGSVGVIFMCFMVLFFIFIFFSIYLLYSKININVHRVKQDLFNIVQNAIFAFDDEELSYNNFDIDEEILIQRADELISLNYDNVKLKYLSYNKTESKVYITVEVDLNLEKWKIKDKVEISESVKLDMMEIDDDKK